MVQHSPFNNVHHLHPKKTRKLAELTNDSKLVGNSRLRQQESRKKKNVVGSRVRERQTLTTRDGSDSMLKDKTTY